MPIFTSKSLFNELSMPLYGRYFCLAIILNLFSATYNVALPGLSRNGVIVTAFQNLTRLSSPCTSGIVDLEVSLLPEYCFPRAQMFANDYRKKGLEGLIHVSPAFAW